MGSHERPDATLRPDLPRRIRSDVRPCENRRVRTTAVRITGIRGPRQGDRRLRIRMSRRKTAAALRQKMLLRCHSQRIDPAYPPRRIRQPGRPYGPACQPRYPALLLRGFRNGRTPARRTLAAERTRLLCRFRPSRPDTSAAAECHGTDARRPGRLSVPLQARLFGRGLGRHPMSRNSATCPTPCATARGSST